MEAQRGMVKKIGVEFEEQEMREEVLRGMATGDGWRF